MSSSRGPACRRPASRRHTSPGPCTHPRARPDRRGARVGAARTAFARANARLGVLAGIAAVVLLLAGLGAGVVDALAGAATGGLRAGLAATTGADGAIRWQIRLADDPDAQAEAAGEVLDRMLVPNGAVWARSVQTAPVAATVGAEGGSTGGSPFGAVLLADPTLADRADLVDGAWADSPESVAAADAEGASATTLHADAAADLGLDTGDLVTLTGDDPRRLLVVGTWLPVDANDPAWFGEPIVATGVDRGRCRPIRRRRRRDDGCPGSGRRTLDRAARHRRADARHAPRCCARPSPTSNPHCATGPNSARAGSARRAISAPRSPACSRASAPCGRWRRCRCSCSRSPASPRSPGSRRCSVLRDVPRRPCCAPAAPRPRASRAPPHSRCSSSACPPRSSACSPPKRCSPPPAPTRPATGRARGSWHPSPCVAAVVIVAGRAFIDARRPVLRGSGDEVGRAPRTAVAGGALLIAVAAAIALWQFRLYGSPLVTSSSGRVDVDPVAVLAPVLVLARAVAARTRTDRAGRRRARAPRGRAPRPGARAADAAARAPRRALRVGVVRHDARGRRPHPHRRVRGRLAVGRPPDVGAHRRRRGAGGVRRP